MKYNLLNTLYKGRGSDLVWSKILIINVQIKLKSVKYNTKPRKQHLSKIEKFQINFIMYYDVRIKTWMCGLLNLVEECVFSYRRIFQL